LEFGTLVIGVNGEDGGEDWKRVVLSE
jgi:hypothetical protein